MSKMPKPSRSDLLAIVSTLQSIIGAIGTAASDRNPNRAAHIEALVQFGHELCIKARESDPPSAGENSTWAKLPRLDLSKVV